MRIRLPNGTYKFLKKILFSFSIGKKKYHAVEAEQQKLTQKQSSRVSYRSKTQENWYWISSFHVEANI